MKRHYSCLLITLFLFSCWRSSQKNLSNDNTNWTLVYHNDFTEPLRQDVWKVEMDSLPNSTVEVADGKLVLNTKGGVTVWLNKKFHGDIKIAFNRKVLLGSGSNDRLSDVNQFWMATDPQNENLFTRDGKFEQYDSLQMYYVGFGGNHNSTSRLRKYMGNGEKTLLSDLNDEEHLLQPNHEYFIEIIVEGENISFWVDGKPLFQFIDPNPLRYGYFGFRSTWSRQEIDNLNIFQREPASN